ncbi:receptor-type tyrosine-protein phosphatase alpha-like [Saccostrea cucullata]|uniref:receptor-type tyrosine-protein phosphatase alpha-like n=1 Tax=Saccostrea cuccullata TaxID=36930 RepID=UPI002ED0FA2B
MECSVNCERQTCDSITGSCTYGCKRGFYLEKCNQNCNESCPSACNRYSGYCEGKCPPGKYGNACNKICNPNCKNECGRNNGLCDSGCIFGKFGADCLRSCGAGCVSSCRQNDGSCQCKSGWKGPNCDGCDLKHYEQDCSKKCSANCERENCDNITGSCTHGCERGFYLEKCEKRCSTSCPSACNRYSGECEGECSVGKYGEFCNKTCSQTCNHRCRKIDGLCTYGCIDGKFGAACLQTCGDGCISGCHQTNGNCSCKTGWQGQNCDECSPNFYGNKCDRKCSSNCLNETCFSKNGFCIGGCKGDFTDEQCTIPLVEGDSTSLPFTAIGAGLGAGLFLLVIIIIVVIFLRRRKNSYSKPDTVLFRKEGTPSLENRLCMNIGDVPITIEDPEEEPQIENPEEAVYYNELSVAKDISVSDLLKIITEREAKENEGFLKEFKMLPYGERFDCEIAKAEKNMPKNRFKTTFPYDHSRVVLDTSQGFTSDYINANYIENMEGERDFIACQGPLKNTLVDHWRMIWQENVEYIVMLTNLIEGPKVKCHQYWPDKGQELDVNPFAVTLVEEKQYAYFVERRMTLRNKKVAGSRTIVQYHYTRWPDHGTPNPLNLIVFHRHFRHKSRSTQHPIIVHCSAGIGRTGTFIALDVLCRYGKDKGKVNVIEYVKAMRRDRMTMIQNVDQYVFLYHALYEFFRRKVHYIKRDEFLSQYGDMNKMLTNEFNELVSLKPKYDASEFKSGKKFSELNFTKSVLPVEQHLVYLTSHVQGRQCYYNAVNVCSFTRADEFLSAQFPVSGAAIDLVRLLTDQESAFLISLNPLSELKELQSWVDGKDNPLKLNPYVVTKGSQEVFSGKIRKTNLKISTKEETHHVEIFECLNWSSKDTLPTDTSVLTTLIKQFSLDRKANINGPVTVISKDGATCCGVFIAVYNAIEQLQQDDEVDIFTIVQQIQCRRPEMISTKDEYEFCFKAVSDFLNTESVYANT